MCVRGSMYSQTCTSSSQCVPTSAGFSCLVPYTGASYTVCKCTSSQYLDTNTGVCTSLKSLNVTCKDTNECSGGVSGSMICGQYSYGSPKVCMCTDLYYANGNTCSAKYAYYVGCPGSTSFSYLCLTHLNQTCNAATGAWRCSCNTGLYFDDNSQSCKQELYRGDRCTLGTQCWSGTCTSNACT
jgi:hypothetical protein